MIHWHHLAREVVQQGHNAVVDINGNCAPVVYTEPREFEGDMTQSSEHRIEFFDIDFPGTAERDDVNFRDGRTFVIRQLFPVDEVGLRKASLTTR